MKLSDAIRDQFDSIIRSRGKMYADWNLVKIISTCDSLIKAEINESYGNVYDVVINIEPHQVIIDCTCPDFESSGACKHIWATVITAEKNGFESNTVTDKTILVEKDLLEDEDNLDYEEDDFLDLPENPGFNKLKNYLKQDKRTGSGNIYQFTKKGSSLQKPPPDWKSLFSISGITDSYYSQNRTRVTELIYYEIGGNPYRRI